MTNEAKVDKYLIRDVIDSILKHGDNYKEKLKELNQQFRVPYDIKDHIVRHYPERNKPQHL